MPTEKLLYLVSLVARLPPSQCVPRRGAIAASPSEPGHCGRLLIQ